MNKVEKKQVLLEFIRLTRERLIARRKQKLRKRTRSNWPATASQPDLSPSRAKYFLVQSELHSWDHSSTEEKRLSYKYCALHNTLMCNGVYSSGKSKIQENWIIILQKKTKRIYSVVETALARSENYQYLCDSSAALEKMWLWIIVQLNVHFFCRYIESRRRVVQQRYLYTNVRRSFADPTMGWFRALICEKNLIVIFRRTFYYF